MLSAQPQDSGKNNSSNRDSNTNSGSRPDNSDNAAQIKSCYDLSELESPRTSGVDLTPKSAQNVNRAKKYELKVLTMESNPGDFQGEKLLCATNNLETSLFGHGSRNSPAFQVV